MSGIRRLPGTRDLWEEEYLRLQGMQSRLQQVFSLHGYRFLDTPILEPAELFLKKSGGELLTRTYTFNDPGGHRVSLRPEFTSSVLRAFAERKGQLCLPLRCQYAGPVFRQDGDAAAAGSLRTQFTQVGVELLGAPGPQADAEVLALAATALHEVGVRGHVLVIGSIAALEGLLSQLDISERGKVFLLSQMGLLRQGPPGREEVQKRAQEIGLLRRDRGRSIDQADRVAQVLLAAEPPGLMGSRTSEEILSRFFQKLKGLEDPKALERALELLGFLAQVRGEPSQALSQASDLVREYGLDPSPLNKVEQVLEYLSFHDLKGAQVYLDWGLARGIAYYTGTIFELENPSPPRLLGGGGRYDGLIRSLGLGQDIPALGFAYNLERVLEATTLLPPQPSGPVRLLVVPQGPGAYRTAVRVCQELRGRGQAAELAVGWGSLEENLESARARGLDGLVLVDENGERQRYWVGQRAITAGDT